MTHANAKSLYKTVSGLGLKRAQVRQLLPDWWSDEIEQTEDGAIELALHMSRRLSIDYAALQKGQLLSKGAVTDLAFKHRADVDPQALSAATHIASSLAQAILAALPTRYTPLPLEPEASHRSIKEVGGTLNFEALLDLCWRHGIPVIPLPHLPVGIRKMDGAALLVGDRPAIVIAKKKSSRAWLSFILAHEIGHIALEHVQQGTTIVDISLQDAATYASDELCDRQEMEADAFALALMGGEAVGREVGTWSRNASAVDLALRAKQKGINIRIEAGHLVLRHAFITKRWAEAMTALRFLSEDMNPEQALLGRLAQNVELDRVAEDLRDLVTHVTGWDNLGNRDA
jgi:hypothetical protein